MKPVSLADITYEQGLKLIAMRKQAIDSGKVRPMTKEALDNSYMLRYVGSKVFEKAAEGGWLDQIKGTLGNWGQQAQQGLKGVGDQIRQGWKGINAPTRDVLKKGLIGAGIGGLGGIGSSIINRDENWGRNALMGGIAGGAIGGGIGLATNPEAATAIQNRLRSFMKTPEEAASDSPDSSPGGAAKQPPKTPAFAAEEAKRLLEIEDPELQMTEVNRRQSTADSYAPEALHGSAAAVGGYGTYRGIKRLRNIEGFDPTVLANKLLAGVEGFSDKGNELKTILGVNKAQLKSMTVPQIEKLLASKGFSKNLMGGLDPAARGNLLTLLRGNKNLGGVDALDDVLIKGFRGNRPIRAGGSAGLVGLAGLGGWNLLKSYMEQAKRRENAQHVLEQLKYQLD